MARVELEESPETLACRNITEYCWMLSTHVFEGRYSVPAVGLDKPMNFVAKEFDFNPSFMHSKFQ